MASRGTIIAALGTAAGLTIAVPTAVIILKPTMSECRFDERPTLTTAGMGREGQRPASYPSSYERAPAIRSNTSATEHEVAPGSPVSPSSADGALPSPPVGPEQRRFGQLTSADADPNPATPPSIRPNGSATRATFASTQSAAILRTGLAWPITHSADRQRVNLILVTSSWDAERWNDPAFLTRIEASDGTFPVRVWRMRRGETVAQLVTTIRVPAYYAALHQVSLSSMGFTAGDVAIVEVTEGIHIARGYDEGIAVPLMSEVNQVSGDPTTRPPAVVEFEGSR